MIFYIKLPKRNSISKNINIYPKINFLKRYVIFIFRIKTKGDRKYLFLSLSGNLLDSGGAAANVFIIKD